jgi:hypothetical protein
MNKPLSSLFADPSLRKVFEKAERDLGDSFPVPTTPSPKPLEGGAVEPKRERVVLCMA